MSEFVIPAERSAIWAADVEPRRYFELAPALGNVGLGGVKLGFDVGLGMGLPAAVEAVKGEESDLVVIYDHQKAGTDIPGTGKKFAKRMKDSGIDAAILFPFSGLNTQETWTSELQERGVKVIVGSEMTHMEDRYNHLKPGAFERMFELAIKQDVKDFVVPGNKVDRIKYWKGFFDERMGEGSYAFMSPGLIDQGGDISATGQAAGPIFHGIVGGGINGKYDEATDTYERSVDEVREAAVKIVNQVKNS